MDFPSKNVGSKRFYLYIIIHNYIKYALFVEPNIFFGL